MASANLRSLVNKLNTNCRQTLEAAAGLCLSRTNYHVELEHWLLKLMEVENTDLTKIFKHYSVDAGKVARELTRALDQMRTGNGRAPDLSLDILDLMKAAWSQSSLDYGATELRSGYLLVALLTDRALSLRIAASSTELAKLPADRLQQEAPVLVRGSSEDEAASVDAQPGTPGQPSGGGKTQALDQFTMNLTERARRGEIDPVVGRDFEIRQVIDILTRRRQNNPILTGEAGVGKTAVVEGFALRIISRDVPQPLRNVEVRTLDLGLLQAGAGVKGEFENRLKSVIAEVKASPTPIILFIDEAHTLVGAGGQAGQGDAANLIKPALARGELRTIAATTWMEYKKYFETDAALKRRFQVVKVDEPDEAKAILMLRCLTPTLEKHHKVRILEEALEDASKLSSRYITDRQLPDKAVSLLDTACAKVALSQSSTPPELEDARREIELAEVEIKSLERENEVGIDHGEELQELIAKKDKALAIKTELEKRWEEEKRLVAEIQAIYHKLQPPADAKAKEAAPAKAAVAAPAAAPAPAAPAPAETPESLCEQLNCLWKQLAAVQGERPLVHPVVDRQAVADVVSGWTGIPVGKMVLDEIKTILSLRERMEERVIGQSHALEMIAERIKTSRAALGDPRRPIGVFMLAGPSGVGKTETAMVLSDILYGGDRNMVVINMSEYKEEHKISRLTGSAPGYVGYGEGGVLTEAVRRKPYCIVLLDEVEKAHPAVQEIFYQVFDKGMLQDDKGNEINFKNTIIILTSNAGSDVVMKVCADPDTRPDPEGLATALRPELLKVFKPALLGRIEVVPYYPLSDEVLKQIIQLQFKRIRDRIRENHRAEFCYEESVITEIAARCKEVESGARNADHIITQTVLPEISQQVLARLAEGKTIQRIHVAPGPNGKFVYEIS